MGGWCFEKQLTFFAFSTLGKVGIFTIVFNHLERFGMFLDVVEHFGMFGSVWILPGGTSTSGYD